MDKMPPMSKNFSITGDDWLNRRWVEYSILAFITLLASVLRFYKLGEWSFWVDEFYTLTRSLPPYGKILNKPFFMITKFSLDSFGVNALSLRLFPCLFGILTIPLLYCPFRSIFNKPVALLAIFLMAISPWHIYLSQLARWYSLLLLASTFSSFSFYFFIERNSLKYLVISLLLLMFAFLLHLTAGFVLMIWIVYLFFLTRIPDLQPEEFSNKKLTIYLLIFVALALTFTPRFIEFAQKWEATKQTLGYWGSTPVIFTLKVLYHLTPTIGVISIAGLLLILTQRERKGLFLAIYCLLPFTALNVAALFETNVSAKYVLFTLPGLLLATSYLCVYVITQIRISKEVTALAIMGALVLPSLQTDFTYFTYGYGNRDRLKEAVYYIKDHISPEDQILFLHFFNTSKERNFYVKTMAELADFTLEDERFIVPSVPGELDLSRRIWVLTIGTSLAPPATGFYKWIAVHTSLVAEFEARKGPKDSTVKIYLHRPKYHMKSGRLVEN